MTNGEPTAKPRENTTRINADGDLEYADQDGNWILYQDPPTFLSGKDPAPGWVQRGTDHDDEAESEAAE